MVDALKSVAILNLARDIKFMPELAKRLRESHGSMIHLYVNQRDQAEYYRRQFGEELFDSINLENSLMPTQFGQHLDEEEVIATALRNEKRYSITINKLIVGHRHFGRGFALGGPNFPKSFQSEKTEYIDVLNAYNNMFAFWEREIAEKSISLMINPASAHEGCVARGHDIPMRALVNTRTKNLRMWAHDERQSNPMISTAFDAIVEELPEVETIEIPAEQFDVENIFMKRLMSISGFAKTAIQTLKNHAKWHLKGEDKARIYYFGSEIKFAWRNMREYKKFRKDQRLVKFSDIKDKRFVYFPLGVEPELAISVGSPEYFYQHAAIAAIARDLPANLILVVKEHALGIGRRPESFYDQLHDLKNVVMLDLSVHGVEVVQKAEAVVTIRGSSGQEAAIMGKPTITFGRQNSYNFLPHAHVITDESMLPRLLLDIAERKYDIDKMKRDGARFQRALTDVSFVNNTGWYDHANFDHEMLEAAYKALIASLEWDLPNEI
jgi:hypothetical protein